MRAQHLRWSPSISVQKQTRGNPLSSWDSEAPTTLTRPLGRSLFPSGGKTRQTGTLWLPFWVRRSPRLPPSGRQGGGSEPQWPAWHRCLRPARPVAPPQQTRRPLAGSSGHREPQVPARRRGWRARVPAGRSLSSQRPGPAPTWLNQARLCLADLNIWIPARPLPRLSRAGPLFHQRTPGTVPVLWDPDCFPKSDALAYAHHPNTRQG